MIMVEQKTLTLLRQPRRRLTRQSELCQRMGAMRLGTARRRQRPRPSQGSCALRRALYRELGPLATASVAIDGSKFKAANNRDNNFTRAKVNGGALSQRRALRAI
jgi:hypothetical protein